MLTAEESAALEAMAAQGPTPRATAIDALRFLQARRGHISDESLQDLAGVLTMQPAELDEVATFYNLIFRRPVGRHVILLCDSAVCWMQGRDALQARLTERLGVAPGEISKDGKFSHLPIVCLGACDKAPALMIGEDLHGNVDIAALDHLLDALA